MGESSETTGVIEFYVSPSGDDSWSGKLPARNRQRTDGPFATIERARDVVRGLKVDGRMPGPVRVILRGGVYTLREPLVFTPDDSGTPAATDWQKPLGPDCSVTYAAYAGEEPILGGGRRIDGWKRTTVNGREAWVTSIPDVARGEWNFTQLWVNGRRAKRPRLPKKGLYQIEELFDVHYETMADLFKGQDRFRFKQGDLRPWRNTQDVEFVALHYWIESRVRLKSVDPVERIAELQAKPRMRLSDDFTKGGAPYYVENVFEALDEPGQWYLDRPGGKLYYLPRKGESIRSAEVIAPVLSRLLVLKGDAANKRHVAYVHFDGLTFSHCEWTPGAEAATATPQAACHVPGAVGFYGVEHCSIRNSRVTHVGGYGIEVADGSFEVELSHNTITDLGGGGVKVWHLPPADVAPQPHEGLEEPPADAQVRPCRRVTIADNEIGDGGYRFHQAVGVLIGKCSGNKVLHNHIHDFDYTGISVGWTWGYGEGEAYGNVIEYNHVHDIGRGMLSDMGGIYTLGVSPGTRIRFNVFHDVQSRGYGGWAIYTDEGSTDILIENNLAYRTKSQGFHQHYGRDNIVRNNIFAFGGEAQVARSRLEGHQSFRFTNNIVYGNGDGKVLAGDWKGDGAVMDRNLYYNESGKSLDFAGGSFAKWRKRGMDRNSIVADPLFVNPRKGDFRLKKNSPALRVGFQPFDLSTVGPRRRAT